MSTTVDPAPDSQTPVEDTDSKMSKKNEEDEKDEEEQKDQKEPKEQKKKKKDSKVSISGFVQIFFKQRFETSGDATKEPSLFRVQRLRLTFKGKIIKHVSYKVEIDPRAPTIASLLRDCYLRVSGIIPHHKIQIGQMKAGIGYEALESSSRLYVVNRAQVSDNLSHGRNGRDLGIGLYGKLPLSEHLTLEDSFMLVNGSGANVQADTTHRKNLFGRVGVRYDDADHDLMVRGGISGAYGDQTDPIDTTVDPPIPAFTVVFKRVGADLQIDQKYAWFGAEYIRSTNDSATMPDANGTSYGYYAMLVGKLPHHTGPLARWEVLEDFQGLTFGGYWGDPTAKLRVLVNYEIYEDSAGAHDHKLYIWTQGRF